jgi:hypothetical protein
MENVTSDEVLLLQDDLREVPGCVVGWTFFEASKKV